MRFAQSRIETLARSRRYQSKAVEQSVRTEVSVWQLYEAFLVNIEDHLVSELLSGRAGSLLIVSKVTSEISRSF